ncbi:MAG: SHOCT domain-containing protein [Acidobacteriota bacterium]|nr:SHOCT domain-containing protein [Acidobacteriota bacterium]
MPYEMWNGGPGAGWWVGGTIMTLIVWGALVVLVMLIVRNVGHRHEASPGEPAAIETLKMRFARGEIDEDEFKRRVDLLKNTQ